VHCTKAIQKFGVECDGYAEIQQARTHQVIKPLQPTRHARFIINRLPNMSPHRNEQEYRYLRFFREETAKDLSGLFEDRLWLRIIPQACYEEVVLRDLTISISALIIANNSSVEGAPHREYAYKRYSSSICRIRNELDTRDERDVIRIALISSILIFCFESFQGDHEMAIKHMESSLKLMRKRFLTGKHTFSVIRPQSGVPHMEHDLLAVCVRMDNSLTSRPGLNGIPRTSMLDIDYGAEDFEIPTKFTSIFEARNYLEHIQYVAMPVLGNFSEDSATRRLSSHKEKLRKRAESQLQSWHRAFTPFIDHEKAESEFSKKTSIAQAMSLRSHVLATEIAVREIDIANSIIGVDEFVSMCWEIISICRLTLKDSSFVKKWVWDCGIIAQLFIVISSCDIRNVRQEAVDILKKAGPRREFLWDAAAVANYGDVLLGI
jgi:hypothetical protein